MKRRYQFFNGLDGDGIRVTLEEYGEAGWEVVQFGQDADGFWILLVSPSE